jgi:putative Holliday junction resolvase
MALHKRILALDPGTKRIGVALSDEMRWIAQPLETFERRTLDADVAHIGKLIRDHEVGQVIMGMPLRLDGRMGPEAERVEKFKAYLEEALSISVIAWDERLTSKSAEAMLIEADVSRKKRRGAIDRVAAAILLQSYLASLSNETARAADRDPSDPEVEGEWFEP